MDERELIARLQKRDEAAFEELIRQYEKKVYTLCFRMCGNSEDAEEAAETIMAAKDKDLLHVVWEVTDVWFHTMVLLAHFGLSVDDVLAEFRRREGVSGIDEKKARTAG